MKKLLFVLFLGVTCFATSAQEKGDVDYIFRSLSAAKENPEMVYHLKLSKKKLEEFPENLNQFKNLKTLDLSKNKISMLPAEIGELQNLEQLNFERNKIYSLPPQIKKLKNLEVLLLARNDIEKIPAEIAELASLKKLDLWSNNIKEIHPAIKKLQGLETLDLQGMLIEDEVKKELIEWLPETTIHFSGGCDCGF